MLIAAQSGKDVSRQYHLCPYKGAFSAHVALRGADRDLADSRVHVPTSCAKRCAYEMHRPLLVKVVLAGAAEHANLTQLKCCNVADGVRSSLSCTNAVQASREVQAAAAICCTITSKRSATAGRFMRDSCCAEV